MSRRKVTVEVSETGATRIEADGFRGDECVEWTAELERLLGMPSSNRETKPEFELRGRRERSREREVERARR